MNTPNLEGSQKEDASWDEAEIEDPETLGFDEFEFEFDEDEDDIAYADEHCWVSW